MMPDALSDAAILSSASSTAATTSGAPGFDMAHVGAEVRRADKDGVDTFDQQKIVERVETRLVLDLYDEAHLVIRRRQIFGVLGEAGGACAAPPTPRMPFGG